MAKPPSKKHHLKFLNLQVMFRKLNLKTKKRHSNSKNPHRSFRRSYREDYQRELEIPGIMAHIFATLKILFTNWRLFLPLILIAVLMNILLVGMMNESTYNEFRGILDRTSAEVANGHVGNVAKATLLLASTVTTGGLSHNFGETSLIFAIIIFLIVWLTTIYLLRHLLARQKIKLRDGLYNSTAPLIPTFIVFIVALFQCLPIFIFINVYSVAMQTNFLATPFYALVFFIFSLALFTLSGYCLSSSVVAFIAVTAPGGLYPMEALRSASDLMFGRRLKLILRLIAFALADIIIWGIVMLPLILLDIWLKTFAWTAGIPFVPFCLLIMTCFTVVFFATYLYLYYRWMLDYEEE